MVSPRRIRTVLLTCTFLALAWAHFPTLAIAQESPADPVEVATEAVAEEVGATEESSSVDESAPAEETATTEGDQAASTTEEATAESETSAESEEAVESETTTESGEETSTEEATTEEAVAEDETVSVSSEESATSETTEESTESGTDAVDDSNAVAEEVEIDEAVEESAEGVSLKELLVRLPEFGAVLHSAAVHMPIALWLFGAMFVVLGMFAPSWRNQIPLACLIGGAIFSVGAALTGWWVADADGWNEWNDFSWDEKVVQHRWFALIAVGSSFMLSILALVSQAKQSPFLGFLWRVGLIALALWIGFVGHLGGELMKGEGFFEEALEIWLNGE